ncbi:MAG: sensor histidine kinase [Jatrophihabitans sp.]|uniref:sensor histidine kinase n=1 Tax=Jatrophihabitans sp. TaxID=1932789 RepID=UPI00391587BA
MDRAGGARRRLARPLARVARWPRAWWARQSLRARLTLLATALFSFAVITGAILLLVLQRYALTRVLDQSANKTAGDVAQLFSSGKEPRTLPPTTGGITAVQVVNAHDDVISASPGADPHTSIVGPSELSAVRGGDRPTITSSSDARLRVVGRKLGARTILVSTDVSRVEDSQRILTRAALIGSPLAVLLMALASYAVAALTLRPVAALRHGAADITAAGLAKQRLPVPDAQDEIHRLAVTLNAMLDRIESATSRQRTFVGDAAHELRSPLASLRVQLEVAQRLGPTVDWSGLIDDVLVDVERLDRLVEDLLSLARLDESGALTRRDPLNLDEIVQEVVAGYGTARVPVVAETQPSPTSGDAEALRRVIINLVNNAVRYAATEVHMSVAPDKQGGKPVIRMIVDDDGPGIAEAERERVFDRFYRVQESRSRQTGGTGLGLPIVRDVVNNHGGRVRLAERPDGRPGLRAVVVLPGEPE